MLQGGYVSLEGLLSYMCPTAEELSASYKARLEQLRDEVKGLSLANLGDSAAAAETAAADGAAAGGAAGGGRLALLTGDQQMISPARRMLDCSEHASLHSYQLNFSKGDSQLQLFKCFMWCVWLQESWMRSHRSEG